MKKLGVIGGAGPLASALFYETLVYEAYNREGKIPEIFLINYPFTRGLTINEGQAFDEQLQSEILFCAYSLYEMGAEIGILVCNTLHLYLQKLKALPFPFLSIPSLLLDQAKKEGCKQLLLLGTENTCHSLLYTDPHLKMRIPKPSEQEIVNAIINRILNGQILEDDSLTLSLIVNTIIHHNPIDGIILGCTELPVLHHHYPIISNVKFYDSVKLSASSIYSTILQGDL